MRPKSLSWIATTGLRIALATAFLSSVAGRLGLWGKYGSGWEKFVKYTESVNWYLPVAVVPALAILATILETCFGLALLVGWQTRKAARCCSRCSRWQCSQATPNRRSTTRFSRQRSAR